jgi:hypothetical protein
MKRYRLCQGKLREHPEGEWVPIDTWIDLLEACKDLTADYNVACRFCGALRRTLESFEPQPHSPLCPLLKGRAAIAKAEGDSE